MVLTTEDLLRVREECLADDIEIPAEAVSWVEAEAREYFESGGTKFPRHIGLEGAETHTYFERTRDEEMNSAATMLEALKMTVGGPAPAPAADGSGLRAGARVQTHGLLKKPELNWLVGTVAKQRKDGRWAVELDDGRQVAFKPDNLKLLASENLEVAAYVAAPQAPGSSKLVPIVTPNEVE